MAKTIEELTLEVDALKVLVKLMLRTGPTNMGGQITGEAYRLLTHDDQSVLLDQIGVARGEKIADLVSRFG